MRLTILAQTYLFDKTASINGTLVQLHNLANGFQKAGVEVHYICTTKNSSKPKEEVIDGIHFYWIQANKGFFEWKRQMPLYKKILETIAPDAVYVRGRNVLQYIAGNYADKNNGIYVWGTNGDDSAEFWKNTKRLKNSSKSFLKKVLLLPLKAYEDIYINKGMKLANFVVNQSLQQQTATFNTLNKKGIILPSYFSPVVNKFNKRNEILWLATLSQNKQPEFFIDIVRGVLLNGWKGILGGGSPDRKYEKCLKKRIGEHAIDMIGGIAFEDSFKYYQQAKIYINTSRPDSDGLPNAYIQSWLSGVVVLSLHHNPNNWFETYNIGYCSNGDIHKLKMKLEELMTDDQQLKTMSENSRRFAEEKFAHKTIIKSYINLFTK